MSDALEEATIRANRAKQLLEDDLFVEGFEALRTQLIQAWQDSPARDAEGRERIWQYVKQLDKLKGHLETVMSHGRMAEYQIQALVRDQTPLAPVDPTKNLQEYSAALRD